MTATTEDTTMIEPITTRYARWLRAFARERRIARELVEAYAAAHQNGITDAEQRRARRVLARANAAHCNAMRRERNARRVLSRADLDRAYRFAQEVVAA